VRFERASSPGKGQSGMGSSCFPSTAKQMSITKLAAAKQVLKLHLCIRQAGDPAHTSKQTYDKGVRWVGLLMLRDLCCALCGWQITVAKTVENSIKLRANNRRRSILVDVVYIIFVACENKWGVVKGGQCVPGGGAKKLYAKLKTSLRREEKGSQKFYTADVAGRSRFHFFLASSPETFFV